jgi:hypothetical protein
MLSTRQQADKATDRNSNTNYRETFECVFYQPSRLFNLWIADTTATIFEQYYLCQKNLGARKERDLDYKLTERFFPY